MSSQAVPAAQASHSTRWVQLVLGIVCMASVANLQYGWTLFVLPILAAAPADQRNELARAA